MVEVDPLARKPEAVEIVLDPENSILPSPMKKMEVRLVEVMRIVEVDLLVLALEAV